MHEYVVGKFMRQWLEFPLDLLDRFEWALPTNWKRMIMNCLKWAADSLLHLTQTAVVPCISRLSVQMYQSLRFEIYLFNKDGVHPVRFVVRYVGVCGSIVKDHHFTLAYLLSIKWQLCWARCVVMAGKKESLVCRVWYQMKRKQVSNTASLNYKYWSYIWWEAELTKP